MMMEIKMGAMGALANAMLKRDSNVQEVILTRRIDAHIFPRKF